MFFEIFQKKCCTYQNTSYLCSANEMIVVYLARAANTAQRHIEGFFYCPIHNDLRSPYVKLSPLVVGNHFVCSVTVTAFCCPNLNANEMKNEELTAGKTATYPRQMIVIKDAFWSHNINLRIRSWFGEMIVRNICERNNWHLVGRPEPRRAMAIRKEVAA